MRFTPFNDLEQFNTLLSEPVASVLSKHGLNDSQNNYVSLLIAVLVSDFGKYPVA